jgi:ABC-type polysaccharide/polyol phosphate export permease
VNTLRDVIRFRDLLYTLTWRDISIKYKQSVLGLLWAVLMPGVILLAGVTVKLAFSKVSGVPLGTADLASVAVKAVPWAFFVAAIRFCTTCLLGNANLVTKIYFPKVVLPLAAVGSQFFDFLIAAAVLSVLLAFLGVAASIQLLWVPVLTLLMFVLAAGLGFMLSAASLFFRDVKYIVEIVITFAIFFTPVFYDVSMFEEWSHLLLLNPVAPILEGFRAVVVSGQPPDAAWTAYSGCVAVATFGLAVVAFRRAEPAFAECI